MPHFLVLFKSGATTLEAVAAELEERGLDVSNDGDILTASWEDGPEFEIGINCGESVLAEARELATRTSVAALARCDARFEASFDDLAEVLDEANTLIEIQDCLQELSGGYAYLPWNNGVTPASG